MKFWVKLDRKNFPRKINFFQNSVKETPVDVFSCEFYKIFKNQFLTEHF